MSAIRRTNAEFTPAGVPTNDPSGLPSACYVQPGSSQEHKAPTSTVVRKFSNEGTAVPIPPNTSADDFIYVDTLSRSTFADVVRVQRKDTKELIMVKAFNHCSWRSEYLFGAELRVLQEVNSPWLVGFYGYIQDLREDFLLMEYLSNGSLLELVQKQSLSENQVKFYAAEMFLAVDSLHQHGIMHRNIQLSNFLLHMSGHLRVIGLGMSYQYKEDNEQKPTEVKKEKSRKDKPKLTRITNPVFASPDKAIPTTSNKGDEARKSVQLDECSTCYMAPEVLRLVMPKPLFRLIKRKSGYSFLCDYWSLGVAIYRLMYGYLPFTTDSTDLVLDKVLSHRRTLLFPVNSQSISTAGTALIEGLLKKESLRLGRRDGFAEIQHHVFFSDMQWAQLGHGQIAVPVRNSDLSRYIATGCITSQTEVGTSPNVSSFQTMIASQTSDNSEESDDDVLNETWSKMTMDFPLPLCSDPKVPVSERRATLVCLKQNGESTVTRKSSKESTLGGRKVLKPESAQEAEKTYLQKLMTWFNSTVFMERIPSPRGELMRAGSESDDNANDR